MMKPDKMTEATIVIIAHSFQLVLILCLNIGFENIYTSSLNISVI